MEGNGPTDWVDPSVLDFFKKGEWYDYLVFPALWRYDVAYYRGKKLDAQLQVNRHQNFDPDQTDRQGLKAGDVRDRDTRRWYDDTLQKFGPTVVGTAFLVGTTFFYGPEDAIVSWLTNKGIQVAWQGGKRILQRLIKGKPCRIAEHEVEALAKEYNAARQLRYKLGPNDVDWRGTSKTAKDALDEAFKRTGLSKEEFKVTKWGKDKYGKSHPVEWRHGSRSQAENYIRTGRHRMSWAWWCITNSTVGYFGVHDGWVPDNEATIFIDSAT